jgi:hypothetical protein
MKMGTPEPQSAFGRQKRKLTQAERAERWKQKRKTYGAMKRENYAPFPTTFVGFPQLDKDVIPGFSILESPVLNLSTLIINEPSDWGFLITPELKPSGDEWDIKSAAVGTRQSVFLNLMLHPYTRPKEKRQEPPNPVKLLLSEVNVIGNIKPVLRDCKKSKWMSDEQLEEYKKEQGSNPVVVESIKQSPGGTQYEVKVIEPTYLCSTKISLGEIQKPDATIWRPYQSKEDPGTGEEHPAVACLELLFEWMKRNSGNCIEVYNKDIPAQPFYQRGGVPNLTSGKPAKLVAPSFKSTVPFFKPSLKEIQEAKENKSLLREPAVDFTKCVIKIEGKLATPTQARIISHPEFWKVKSDITIVVHGFSITRMGIYLKHEVCEIDLKENYQTLLRSLPDSLPSTEQLGSPTSVLPLKPLTKAEEEQIEFIQKNLGKQIQASS